ncbi:MAG TPA: response regulator [Chthoniobacteraceae bacterium]|jgi:signal transduction histidine kinase|nr:response regulator [Chthoniobacteraceae bacterium]
MDVEKTAGRESEPPAVEATMGPMATLNALAREPINILLVDDEPKNLMALETVLDDPAYRLVRAGSPNEALLALVHEEFALLILDIQMPEMNGFELAQMIKQRKKTAAVPIIFLTAYFSEDEHVLEGYSTGAVDYLHKPINATVLRSKVAVFTALHRKTRESEVANRALRAEIAERQRAQEELRTLNAELERRVADRTGALIESDRRKDEFLAMLGHELRNPLAAIRHAVRINEDAIDDAAARHWAGGVIDRQTAQLTRMVDDLLDVERINHGRVELRLDCLQLDEVLHRAIEATRAMIDQKGHVFAADIANEKLPVRGDEARLEQVFVNLLGNAVKYTPEQGRIQVSARREAGEVVVTVTDNGIGISPDLLPRVFDLFTQGQTSLDRAQGGLGIGLTVVRALIEMHGGSVTARSGGRGAGATFTVRLPVGPEPATNGSSRRAISTAENLPASLRVLIVDDHADAAQALAMLLRRRNCEVRVSNDGPSGLEAASAFAPEVLLLDLGLPGMDGYEMAQRLRADTRFRDVLFIAISGYAQEADRARAMEAGFDYHCAKPVNFNDLLTIIRSRFSQVSH